MRPGPSAGSAEAAHGRPTVAIVHPGVPRMRSGNRVTALRWASLLRELGCKVFVEPDWSGRACDVLVAVHAAKTLASIRRFRRERPDAQVLVCCAGTDVYGEAGPDPDALEGLAAADRIIALQEHAMELLPSELRERALVVHQSVTLPAALRPENRRPPAAAEEAFRVALIANVRRVKDPLSVAHAARRLAPSSRIRVDHAGAVLEPMLGREVEDEARTNPRYRFLGELPHAAALELIACSRLLVVPSRHEGGANVLSEALALGVPVICTNIPGSTALVGTDYAGLYPPGDEVRLAELLARAETEATFYARLEEQTRARTWIADRARERDAWRELLSL